MTERYITSVRGSVHYWISRPQKQGARCIVLLHGLTADHTLFDRQTEHFQRDYIVLAWDAPAHGASRPYSDPTYANGAEELYTILRTEGIERAIFVGQSMGGYHTQSFYLRHPEMVEAFAGIDTCPYGDYYSASDKWWLRQIGWMARLYPFSVLKHSMAQSVSVTEYGRSNMRTALSHYNKDELCRLMGLGFSDFLNESRPMKLNCPVLILAGVHDVTGKVRHYCKEWHRRTGFPLRWIPDAAHNSNADNPALVNRYISEWIAEFTSECVK